MADMAKLHPDLIEAPIIEDEIHFFKRQAEVASRAQRSDGRTGLVVASAATCGWTVLLQATGASLVVRYSGCHSTRSKATSTGFLLLAVLHPLGTTQRSQYTRFYVCKLVALILT